MKLFKPRYVNVDIDGEQVAVKLINTKEYNEFQSMSDKNAQLKYMIQTSIGITDEQYDNIAMADLAILARKIMQANGLTKEQERAEGNE